MEIFTVDIVSLFASSLDFVMSFLDVFPTIVLMLYCWNYLYTIKPK